MSGSPRSFFSVPEVVDPVERAKNAARCSEWDWVLCWELFHCGRCQSGVSRVDKVIIIEAMPPGWYSGWYYFPDVGVNNDRNSEASLWNGRR